MVEHLVFEPTNGKKPGILYYLIIEILLTILYPLLIILDLFISMKTPVNAKTSTIALVHGPALPGLLLLRIFLRLKKKRYNVVRYRTHIFPQTINRQSEKLESFLSGFPEKTTIIAAGSASHCVIALGYKGRDKINRCYSLQTAWQGNLLNWFLPIPGCWELRVGGNWITSRQLHRISFSSMQSLYAGDEWIWPQNSLRLGRFDDIQLPGFGRFTALTGKMTVYCLEEVLLRDAPPGRQ